MLNQEILGISVSTIYPVVAKVINKRFGDADTDDVVYKNAMKLFIRGGFWQKEDLKRRQSYAWHKRNARKEASKHEEKLNCYERQ